MNCRWRALEVNRARQANVDLCVELRDFVPMDPDAVYDTEREHNHERE
jgi:hypothetical protein